MRRSKSTTQQYGGECALLNKESTRSLSKLPHLFVIPLDPRMIFEFMKRKKKLPGFLLAFIQAVLDSTAAILNTN